MNEEPKANGEEQIAALLQMAGARPRISDETRERVKAAVHDEWQRNISRSRSTRMVSWSAASLAAAAALVFVIVRRGAVESTTPNIAAPQLAAVARKIEGGVVSRAKETRILDTDTPVYSGEMIETSAGSIAALDWSGGSLRIADNSQLRIDSPRALTLTRGAVYFSSAPGSKPVEIRTPFGVVHDIGTQFEVRLAPESVRIRVREGRIDLARNNDHHIAEAGTELSAAAQGDVKRVAISRSGTEWDWVTRAAPALTLDGNVQQLLGHITREKGLALLVTDPSIKSMTMHGNVSLGPDEALDAVASASGLRYRVAKETLFVERKR